MRLVDIDLLKKDFCEQCDLYVSDTVCKLRYTLCDEMKVLDRQPLVEAVPLAYHEKVVAKLVDDCYRDIEKFREDATVHGWWIVKGAGWRDSYTCSVCGKEGDGNEFCSRCGAKMDGEEQ